jgi:hypothetical protein
MRTKAYNLARNDMFCQGRFRENGIFSHWNQGFRSIFAKWCALAFLGTPGFKLRGDYLPQHLPWEGFRGAILQREIHLESLCA